MAANTDCHSAARSKSAILSAEGGTPLEGNEAVLSLSHRTSSEAPN